MTGKKRRPPFRAVSRTGLSLAALIVALFLGAGALMLGDGIATPDRAETPTARAETITGRASVIDGDTIDIHGQRIRLFGIDAPEAGQSCRDGSGRDYRCGQRASLALAYKIGASPVSCQQKDVDQYRRIVAVCYQGGEDLNGWLVSEGWAVAYRQFSTDYVPMEHAAQAARRGIWVGGFTRPADWRRQHR